MDLIKKALEFEKQKRRSLSTSDRVKMSREAKSLILGLNEIYKQKKDAQIMDIMKRLTVIKKKIEKRLKGRPLNEAY
jgi:seryl-tRNA synthetase